MAESIALLRDTDEFIQREDVILPIYSITKTYIAACVFAVGIDIDERISAWLDDSFVSRGSDISVRQLLNHTSGITDYASSPEYHEAIQSGGIWSDEDFAHLTLHQDLLFEPGSKWSYSNPGYWLLSKIVQIESGLGFDAYISKFVSKPLELKDTSVAHGTYAADLPNYPAEWVWPGLLLSTATEVVRFMTSSLVSPLYEENKLVMVPINHPDWANPAWGYGLMVDKGVRYGHNGDGPKYSSACFRFLESGLTGCVLCSAEVEGAATTRLLQMVKLI